ncbi:hypothetical protein [Tsuneonella sp. HG222]
MIIRLMAGALALAVSAVPGAAWADDPSDPSMRSKAARERDAAIIRKLNEDQLAYVRKRDAEYARQWQAQRDAPRQNARAQEEYRRQMAEWRRAVALCQSGRHEYCAR